MFRLLAKIYKEYTFKCQNNINFHLVHKLHVGKRLCGKANSTQLSRHIWNLKDNNTKFSLKWNILKICKSYSNLTNRCNLCNYEKYIYNFITTGIIFPQQTKRTFHHV